jgi:hypothetical protein
LALVLGRPAADREAQGLSLGAALLVHALGERARDFYLRYGFQPSPLDPLTLMLRLPVRR